MKSKTGSPLLGRNREKSKTVQTPKAKAVSTGPASGDVPVASDPTVGYTIFEALEKEIGLKLEIQKLPTPVIVIDHLEEKPTEN
jgi:uncharacterized protein (TIGR03435 family)